MSEPIEETIRKAAAKGIENLQNRREHAAQSIVDAIETAKARESKPKQPSTLDVFHAAIAQRKKPTERR